MRSGSYHPILILRLQNNQNIVIAPADKGCSIVVLDKDIYHQKAINHLNDANTYQKVENDPSVALRSKINRFLKVSDIQFWYEKG